MVKCILWDFHKSILILTTSPALSNSPRLPLLLLQSLDLFKLMLSGYCLQCVHGYRAFQWCMCQGPHPKEIPLFLLQPPVTPLQGLGLSEPLAVHAGVLTILILWRSCADNHRHWYFVWAIALQCMKTVFAAVFLKSLVLKLFSPSSLTDPDFWGERASPLCRCPVWGWAHHRCWSSVFWPVVNHCIHHHPLQIEASGMKTGFYTKLCSLCLKGNLVLCPFSKINRNWFALRGLYHTQPWILGPVYSAKARVSPCQRALFTTPMNLCHCCISGYILARLIVMVAHRVCSWGSLQILWLFSPSSLQSSPWNYEI